MIVNATDTHEYIKDLMKKSKEKDLEILLYYCEVYYMHILRLELKPAVDDIKDGRFVYA